MDAGDHTIGSQSIAEGAKDIAESGDNGKQMSICPMCKGTGYCEEIRQPEVLNFKRTNENTHTKIRLFPNISQEPPYKLEQLFKAADTKTLSRVSEPSVPTANLKPKTRFPLVHIANTSGGQTYSKTGEVNNSPNNSNRGNFPQMINVLPAATKLEKHPDDMARLAAIKMNQKDWETKKAGLGECLQLSYSHPEELEPYMNHVYRTMSSLLNSFRQELTLFTCQAAREFFAHMRSTCRPEFDEIVFSLLNRTADSNRFIRLYANDALDKMVSCIPTVHAVRPLVDKGPTHNNPLVRTACARLLTCIVALKTPNAILTHSNLREACKKILESAALLLADSNLDTRAAAKKLFQRFMNEDEFESMYYAEVEEKLRKRIDRAFVELKYKTHSQI